MDAPEQYANIRDYLGIFIGRTLLDVSQHDKEDFDPENGKPSFVELMFENGTVRFPVTELGFLTSHPDGCPCKSCVEEREEPK